MKLTPSRTYFEDSRGVQIFDDLFPTAFISEMSDYLMHYIPYRANASFDNEMNYIFPRNRLEEMPKLSTITDKIVNKFQPKKKNHSQKLDHGYAAFIRPGQNTMIHRDVECKECLTVLYYVNPFWRADWGGETVFYQDRKIKGNLEREAAFCVTPKPGRLVMFNASLWHCAGIPKMDCPVNRFTLSFFYRCQKEGTPERPNAAKSHK